MQCAHPILVDHPNGYKILVPCGKCANCKATHVQQWVQRLTDEMMSNDVTFFVTLSYDDENICYVTDDNGNYLQTLNRQDYTQYLQKLKYQCDINLINMRYFGCGEYGKSTSRPHYHFAIFLTFVSGAAWSQVQISELLLKPWELGEVNQAVPVSDTSVFAYICKDMYKNHNRLLSDKRLQTFHTMSRRPAIGVPWLKSHQKFFEDAVRRRDRLIYVPRVYQKYLSLSEEDKQKISELKLLDDYELRLQVAKARNVSPSQNFVQNVASNKSLANLRTTRISQKKERF